MRPVFTIAVLCLFTNCLFSLNYSKVITNSKGLSSYKKGDYESAKKHFSENSINNADDGLMNYNLGNSHYKAGEYEQAKGEFEQSLTDKNLQNPSDALMNLGNSHFKTGELEDALLAYKEAILADRTNTNAIKNYETTLNLLKKQQQQQQQQNQNQDKNENQEQEQKEQQQAKQEKTEGENQKAENRQPQDNEGEQTEGKEQQATGNFEKKMAEKMLEEILGKEKLRRKSEIKKRGKPQADGKYW